MEKSFKSKKLNNSRKFSGGGRRPDLKKMKQREAAERQDAWSKLSPQEKLAILDARLGKGLGAKKQRERIMSQLNVSHDEERSSSEKHNKVKAKDRRALEQTKGRQNSHK